MSELQNSFLTFHETIKLEMENNNLLRDKKREVEETLKQNINEYKIHFFDQGSYSTYTGIKPIENNEYDIDRGMVVETSRDDIKPTKLKERIKNALVLKFGNDRVSIKSPCVTVSFPKENVHVDIAVYCLEGEDYFLARGKLGSSPENIYWEDADPKELRNKINNSQEERENREQYRRIIRYLKRWKDIKFKNQENRPTGIGMSVFGLDNFSPNYSQDSLSGKKNFKDIEALIDFVGKMINSFRSELDLDEFKYYPRLEVELPVKPYSDVYKKVSNKQMVSFKEKLVELRETLIEANEMSDIHDATKLLRTKFGDDFPIEDQEKTAQAFATRATINDYPSA